MRLNLNHLPLPKITSPCFSVDQLCCASDWCHFLLPFPGFHHICVAAPAWPGLGAGREQGLFMWMWFIAWRGCWHHMANTAMARSCCLNSASLAPVLCPKKVFWWVFFVSQPFPVLWALGFFPSVCRQLQDWGKWQQGWKQRALLGYFALKTYSCCFRSVCLKGDLWVWGEQVGILSCLGRAEFHRSDCILWAKMRFLCSETVVELSFWVGTWGFCWIDRTFRKGD